MGHVLLSVQDVSKSFPGVQALSHVKLEIEESEIHALVGENGAGKSTLLKIISGVHPPDSGVIFLNGNTLHLHSPRDAQALGIVTIYQEFTLFPNLTIAENIFIGREPIKNGLIDWKRMRGETQELNHRIGLDVDPMTLVCNLSVAEQQLVEIARALSMKSKLLIMDEPTSALSETEVEKLFTIIRNLKNQNLSIIFVTHKIEEIFECCDRFTVLRDGEFVGSGQIADVEVNDIIRMMVGRTIEQLYQVVEKHTIGDIALEVKDLSTLREKCSAESVLLQAINFKVHYGEIVGLAGLVGAGRTEIARAIFGADLYTEGKILIDGRPVKITSPADAIRNGICLVPEDRKQQALFLDLAVRTNFSVGGFDRFKKWLLFFDMKKEESLLESYRDKLKIAMVSPDQIVANVSGGNQQKIVLARWMMIEPKILIVDEPTRGIDVGAKAEVHKLLYNMARLGIAVLIISSELPEILTICDRIITMRQGRITGKFNRENTSEHELMEHMALDKI